MKRRLSSRRSRASFLFSGRIVLIVFLLLVVVLICLYGWLQRSSAWDGQRRFTFIWQKIDIQTGNERPVGIVSLEPRSGRAMYLKLPANTLVDVPYGYKTYPLASVYRLGELDETHGGGVLLMKSIEGTAGMVIDGYAAVQDDYFPAPAQSTDDLLAMKQSYVTWWGLARHIWSASAHVKSVRTDIAVQTWYRLWQAIRHLRADQIQFIDLEKTTALADTHFPDGSLAQAFDRDAFDTIVGDWLQDSQIRSESLTVEVVNASGTDGAAGQVGVMLERLGGHIIAKSTAKTIQKQGCQFFVTRSLHPSDYALLQYVTLLWDCKQGTAADLVPNRSDVRIVIGEDFIK